MKNITDIFLELVSISSPSGNEAKISLFLQKWLISHHFSIQVDTVGNIYAKNNTKGVLLLLCAHMDTVQPGEDIDPIIENGIIKSEGKTILGADNKAAIAAIMTAVEHMKEKKSLELLFTVKEEVGGGVDNFPIEWIGAKKALIFDSANPLGGIVLTSPYITNFVVSFEGKAAHASIPEKGVNAFTPAVSFLSHVKVGVLDRGVTTINIGVINGGSGINTIPDTISIQGEIRSYSKKIFHKHIDHIKNVASLYGKKYKCTTRFTLDGYCSGYSHSKSDPFINSIHSVLQKSGLTPTFYDYSGISDANVLNTVGVKTVNLTDGVQFPHTTSEQITIKDLEKLGEIVKKCIEEL